MLYSWKYYADRSNSVAFCIRPVVDRRISVDANTADIGFELRLPCALRSGAPGPFWLAPRLRRDFGWLVNRVWCITHDHMDYDWVYCPLDYGYAGSGQLGNGCARGCPMAADISDCLRLRWR